MADQNFFHRSGPFTLKELAGIAGAELLLRTENDILIEDVAPLQAASDGQVSFLDNKKYLQAFRDTKAAACIVAPEFKDLAPDTVSLLVTSNPYKAYALVTQAFYPEAGRIPRECGISPHAHVADTADIGEGCEIAAGAVIEEGAVLGKACVVGANAVVARNVEVGSGTVIGPNASLEYCRVGSGCQIHAGARIGTRGFGFTMDPDGFLDVPQIGLVLIGDGVEVGANTTIDRGAGPDTIIGDGTRIDNQVQVGHNAKVGRNCVLVAQVGVAGSAELGDFVVMAAKSGVAGHIKIGTGSQVAAKSGVMKSIAPGQKIGGHPAIPLRDWLKQSAYLNKLVKNRGNSDD
ncbi:UDP-3-O-(3-hydroxymyristoyl)glucosamine N-acyltransferase [Kiloniella sp. b19]|uniref:UDP-3-O-(3-hydroxymyristoyl)glucosamine N-acyltransferase n=1 Tax=Kiloniella sp. GXU_MW_B19 TaxID=3141326 RepID=UPI0031DE2828